MNVHPTPCKPWTGRINDDGYGTIGSRLAHRVAYERAVGPIPAGMTVDHICHTADPSCNLGPNCPHRRCVAPEHLEPVPHGANVRRGRNHWRDKTHCPAGHEYDKANTLVSNGKRLCRACRTASRRRRNAERGTCPRGHQYDGVNARGRRTCSPCMSAAGRAAMRSRWGSPSSGG